MLSQERQLRRYNVEMTTCTKERTEELEETGDRNKNNLLI